jgi:hypothetical protein
MMICDTSTPDMPNPKNRRILICALFGIIPLLPGGFRRFGAKSPPFAAFSPDGLLWRNRAYAAALDQPYEPMGDFNERCFYPLGQASNVALFRGISPASPRKFQIEAQAPAGQVRISP